MTAIPPIIHRDMPHTWVGSTSSGLAEHVRYERERDTALRSGAGLPESGSGSSRRVDRIIPTLTGARDVCQS